MIKRLFALALIVLPLLSACGSGTDSGGSGITRGTDTAAYAGTYDGTLEFQATADAVGFDSQFGSGNTLIEMEVTADGLVSVPIEGETVSGVIDNDGRWLIEVSINDFSSLLGEDNIDALDSAGYSPNKKFGQCSPSTLVEQNSLIV